MQGLCDRIAAHASAGRADLSLTGLLEAWAREAPFGTPSKPWTAADEAYVVAGEVGIDTGVPGSVLSALHGVEAGVGEGDRWVVGGYRQVLAPFLAAVPDLRLNFPVHRICHGGGDPAPDLAASVTVHGPDGASVTADGCVCTIPVAVLAASLRREHSTAPCDPSVPALPGLFDPPLGPSHTAALLSEITTGRVEKVVLRFESRWWPTSPSGYLVVQRVRVA